MPEAVRVLVAGESWVTHTIHIKGYDSFETSSYNEGGTWLLAALRGGGFDVTYQPSHIALNAFPANREALAAYHVVILSDIGANTLLLPDSVAIRSERGDNRLQLLADFVADGGGLLMVGGYLTFQGIQAKGNYRGTPVEAVLPIDFHQGDDRSERPEGVTPEIVDAGHPVLAGLSGWPHFLGYNRSMLKKDGQLLARVGNDPFIAVRSAGRGRTAIFASDCGPHWGPPQFLAWAGYQRLWCNLAAWLAKKA